MFTTRKDLLIELKKIRSYQEVEYDIEHSIKGAMSQDKNSLEYRWPTNPKVDEEDMLGLKTDLLNSGYDVDILFENTSPFKEDNLEEEVGIRISW